jgi:hypothetical protein
VTNIDELLQDIDERAWVACLEFERKADPKRFSEESINLFRRGSSLDSRSRCIRP